MGIVLGALVSTILFAAALWYIVFSATKAGVREALKEQRTDELSAD
jgi:hypothetical protein